MEAVKTYINNVFAAFPQTSEVQALKRDMLADMEEKYNALIQTGKSEHEAGYTIIADFGSMDEIAAELGLTANSKNQNSVTNKKDDKAIHMSWDDAQIYLAETRKNNALVGFGIWLILAGVAVFLLTSKLLFLFVGVAIAVIMFVVSDHRKAKYKGYGKKKMPICIDDQTREALTKEKAKAAARSAVMTAVGIGAIILSAGGIAAGIIHVAVLLLVVGFAVFLFTTADGNTAGYKTLLGKRNS